MTPSANKSETPGLLSARNVILAAAAILVLSVLGSCLSMLRDPDGGGLGRDSFGTRRQGFRALMETLEDVGIAAHRDLAPPAADASDDHTLVVLDADAHLVDYGPKYVQALLAWVDQGGRLVITPSRWRTTYFDSPRSADDEDDVRDLLEVLQLDGSVAVVDSSDNDTEYLETETESYSETGATPPRKIPATKFTGSLERLVPLVRELAVPGDGYTTLAPQTDKVRGTLTVKDTDGSEHVLVAAVTRGKGEIVVVSDAQLVDNELIALADNSVLAVHLLAPAGRAVVFDEFYHGLAVRGNPLYLLTRPGFAAITLGLLASVGLWAWRSAVFLGPPLAQPQPSRRDIRQYIDAMGDYFARSPDHRRFVAREVRDGVLHQLCDELKLPADTADVERILAALRRRDPQRAENLARTLANFARAMDGHRDFPHSEFLPSMQRLAGSL